LFMFAIMKTFVTVISASTGRNDFYIWYMALAWWLVLCLPFPGLPHIYFLFTVWLTNERVGVFLAWLGMQHLVLVTSVSVKVKKVMRAEFTNGGNEWGKKTWRQWSLLFGGHMTDMWHRQNQGIELLVLNATCHRYFISYIMAVSFIRRGNWRHFEESWKYSISHWLNWSPKTVLSAPYHTPIAPIDIYIQLP
jgi:hypothetical protein